MHIFIWSLPFVQSGGMKDDEQYFIRLKRHLGSSW